MITIEDQLQGIVDQVTYGDWKFKVKRDNDSGRPYLQLCFNADDQNWTGRKWFLSPFMTRSEIVQTALKAVLTAVEHEAREHFLYKGRPIFGPHISVEKLWEVCEKVDVRQ